MAVKAFIITQAIFQFGEPLFDFDIAKCHYKLIERLNTALMPFGFQPKEIQIDFTINVFALLAAIIEFSIVKLQIKFGYYFYVKSSMPDQDQEDD